MHTIDIGLASPEERDLCVRIAYRLAKIEQEMAGAQLAGSVACCDAETFEEEYAHIVYYPHSTHVNNLVIVLVDDLGVISVEIDKIHTYETKKDLKDWYYKLKDVLCRNDSAQSYYFNRS